MALDSKNQVKNGVSEGAFFTIAMSVCGVVVSSRPCFPDNKKARCACGLFLGDLFA